MIEKYKLSIMTTIESHLLSQNNGPIIETIKPPKKSSRFAWFLFGSLLVLELVPMIWGGYLGVSELLAPLLSAAATALVTAGFCAIEALLFYAVVNPLLKDALGIPITKNPPWKSTQSNYNRCKT